MADILEKQLNEKQLQAIEYLTSGESNVAIAKLLGISRQTLDNWKKDRTFKAALDRYSNNLKNLGDTAINSKSKLLIDNLIYIALNGKSEKNRLDATIYGLNRVYGAPTNKTESITSDNTDKDKDANKADINDMLKEIDNNIIDISKAR